MNIIDRSIEILRRRWDDRAGAAFTTAGGNAYVDGYRAAMRDAVLDVEHVLHGLSTTECRLLPLPHTVQPHQRVWTIPMLWDPEHNAAAIRETAYPWRTQPVLRLQKIETRAGVWSWLINPTVWTP